jgi:hypothetical protein
LFANTIQSRPRRSFKIIDRGDPMNLFDLVPQLNLALEPVLAELDRLLDDDAVYELVRSDLARRSPQSASRGRPSTPVEVTVRLLVVRRLYDWTYQETEPSVPPERLPNGHPPGRNPTINQHSHSGNAFRTRN